MAAKFKPGDIVQLKSGGPAMTVSEEDDYSRSAFYCVWFKGASKERGSFPADILKLYEAPKKA